MVTFLITPKKKNVEFHFIQNTKTPSFNNYVVYVIGHVPTPVVD